MSFDLTEEQKAIVELAKDFAETEMLPFAANWDETHEFPKAVLRKAAMLGFAGIYVPVELGGSGLSRVDAALIFKELSKACPSTAAYISIHNMVCWMIATYGNHEQQQQWLPQLLTMELLASYCLTEPQSGSDAGSLQTKAILQNNHYVVNGSKAFISGGGATDLYLTMVRTKQEGQKAISCLLIPSTSQGIRFGKPEVKLGWHSQPTSMVFFENCEVDASQRLGQEGEGFSMALAGLNGGRVNIAACSLGGASFAIDYARQYVQERQQFGKAIMDFQHTQFKLADMATALNAASLLVWQAAHAMDTKDPASAYFCAMAKRFATDTGFSIVDEALQLLGGYGYLRDYPIERLLRDLRVHRILEGTNEIMRVVMARHLTHQENALCKH